MIIGLLCIVLLIVFADHFLGGASEEERNKIDKKYWDGFTSKEEYDI